MMRGPGKAAAVVRTKDGLVTKDVPAPYPKEKHAVLGWVFIRGVCNFVQSMIIGTKMLFWSAEQIPLDDPSDTEGEKPSTLGKGALAVTGILAVVLAIGMFTVLPTWLGGLLSPWIGSGFRRNLLETGLRLVILFFYMFLVSKTRDVKRTFSYHGAEHKSIACYEARETLTVENVRRYSRFHPRCGTSFLLTVVVISMVFFLLISLPLQMLPWQNIFVRVGARLALLPFVVAISYEFNRLIGRTDNIVSRIVRSPGLWMQRMTTNEPDDEMLEVAIEALRRVMPEEAGTDEWGAE